jgi:Fic family protein
MTVRENGSWEPWIGFFLRGVRDAATEAHQTALKILALREKYHNELTNEGKGGANMLRALDTLFGQPIVTARSIEGKLKVAFATANGILARFEELGILREMTGSRRNRRWTFQPYVDLFEQTLIKPDSTPPPELTSST